VKDIDIGFNGLGLFPKRLEDIFNGAFPGTYVPLWSLGTVPKRVVVTPQPLSILSYALKMFLADKVLLF